MGCRDLDQKIGARPAHIGTTSPGKDAVPSCHPVTKGGARRPPGSVK